MALSLAEKGIYSTKPNPRVGCVIVKNEKLLGQGWHNKAGEPHAEVMALQNAQKNMGGDVGGLGDIGDIEGATAYINLEPCSHQGKTAPCADALIEANIAEVYVATKDPNPLVNGKGIAKLREAGIKVHLGLLEEEAIELNRGFIHRHTHGRPWVTLKVAQSSDGVMALNQTQNKTENKRPIWITGEAARQDVHLWRAKSCAVLSGASSIRSDNSRLNVRLDSAVLAAEDFIPASFIPPCRIALDPKFRLDPQLDFFTTAGPKLWVGLEPNEPPSIPQGTDLLIMSHQGKTNAPNTINLSDLLVKLSSRGINEILVESGPRLTSAFLSEGLVDEAIVYISPRILREEATTDSNMIFNALDNMTNKFNSIDEQKFGEDLRVILQPVQPSK